MNSNRDSGSELRVLDSDNVPGSSGNDGQQYQEPPRFKPVTQKENEQKEEEKMHLQPGRVIMEPSDDEDECQLCNYEEDVAQGPYQNSFKCLSQPVNLKKINDYQSEKKVKDSILDDISQQMLLNPTEGSF